MDITQNTFRQEEIQLLQYYHNVTVSFELMNERTFPTNSLRPLIYKTLDTQRDIRYGNFEKRCEIWNMGYLEGSQ